jgi:hypothetical protein
MLNPFDRVTARRLPERGKSPKPFCVSMERSCFNQRRRRRFHEAPIDCQTAENPLVPGGKLGNFGRKSEAKAYYGVPK